MTIYLGVDFGAKRTGLALCRSDARLAYPLYNITAGSLSALAEKIVQEARRHSAGCIVIGHPKNMDGSEGKSANRAAELAALVEKIYDGKTALWDERCSTMIAHELLSAAELRSSKRKQVIDSASAVVILQSYVDSISAQ